MVFIQYIFQDGEDDELNDKLRSCEESWKLIVGLRERVSPKMLQDIVRKCGLPTSGRVAELKEKPGDIIALSPKSSVRWLTMADIKVQAVKEICYEIALAGFCLTNDDIFTVSKIKMEALCNRYGKIGTLDDAVCSSVAKDVMDTIGSGADDLVDSQDSVASGSNSSCEETKSHISLKDVEDIVAELVHDTCCTVECNQTSDTSLESSNLESEQEMEEVDGHSGHDIAKLKYLVQKISATPEQAGKLSDKILSMILEHVNGGQENCADDKYDGQVTYPGNHSASSSRFNPDQGISPRYIRSNDFSCPSPGVVLPYEFESKEEQIAWLMENDRAFRRGRLQWLAQQKNYERNLELRKQNKEKRRIQREESKKIVEENNQKFRFQFKNKKEQSSNGKRNGTSSSSKRYNIHPRRKTIACGREVEESHLQSGATYKITQDGKHIHESTVSPSANLQFVNRSPVTRRTTQQYTAHRHKTMGCHRWSQEVPCFPTVSYDQPQSYYAVNPNYQSPGAMNYQYIPPINMDTNNRINHLLQQHVYYQGHANKPSGFSQVQRQTFCDGFISSPMPNQYLYQ